MHVRVGPALISLLASFAVLTAACQPSSTAPAPGGAGAPGPQIQVAPGVQAPVAPQVPAPPQVQAPAAPRNEAVGPLSFAIAESGEAFKPDRITVPAGAVVRFEITNNDADEHNIVSTQLAIASSPQRPGSKSTLEWTAPARPGTYEVFCSFHYPAMTMQVVVQ